MQSATLSTDAGVRASGANCVDPSSATRMDGVPWASCGVCENNTLELAEMRRRRELCLMVAGASSPTVAHEPRTGPNAMPSNT
eukprot:7978592-Alexandrium_andersonii.AAC.1